MLDITSWVGGWGLSGPASHTLFCCACISVYIVKTVQPGHFKSHGLWPWSVFL